MDLEVVGVGGHRQEGLPRGVGDQGDHVPLGLWRSDHALLADDRLEQPASDALQMGRHPFRVARVGLGAAEAGVDAVRLLP